MPKTISDPNDIVDRTFDNLTVISYLRQIPSLDGKRRFDYVYECQCACGKVLEIRRRQLLTHQTKSCGCLHGGRQEKNPNWKGYKGVSGSVWAQIRWKASNRDLPLTITIKNVWDQFITQKGKCALSGIPLVLVSRTDATTASLDRIDSSKGYVHGNIQWVHKDLNHMKSDFTEDSFVAWCQAVATYRGSSFVRPE